MATVNLASVAGTRPNFMKMAPLLRALQSYSHVRTVLVHTGQHYDENLSWVFFEKLGMKNRNVNLEVGAGSHAVQTVQTVQIPSCFETVFGDGASDGQPFHRVVVVGDVNSTLAAVKMGVPVAHVEAGLRSFDRSMPEESNRVMIDVLMWLLPKAWLAVCLPDLAWSQAATEKSWRVAAAGCA